MTKPYAIKCFLFDLDGTLCSVEHRRKYVQGEYKDWKAFNSACVLDKPVRHVQIIHDLISFYSYKIIYCSGRTDEYRKETLEWLELHLGVSDPDLRMRKAGDHRPDNVVKKEILDTIRKNGYDPIAAFDDRDQVVAMWRENGVPCFQVAPGDF